MTEIAFLGVNGLLALLLIVGGMYALKIGYRLYLKGVGLAPDGTSVEGDNGVLKVKASLKTVGSVVMATSVAWGALGYYAAPKKLSIKPGADGVEIGSLDLEVTAPASGMGALSTARLSEMLQATLVASDLPKLSVTTTLASYGYEDVTPSFQVVPDSARATSDSVALIDAVFSTGSDSIGGRILYEAVQARDSVRFIPKSVTFTVGDTLAEKRGSKQ